MTGPLPPTADAAARVSADVWRLFVECIDGAWMFEEDGAVAVFTGLDSATENGVWTVDRDVPAAVLDRLLDVVSESGLPHCLQLRGGASQKVVEVPLRREMTLEAEEPVMILEDVSSLEAPPKVSDLAVRKLGADEVSAHADVVGRVFASPREIVEAVMNPGVMSHPDVRCYAGEADGAVVSTGVAVTHRGATAVFSVATLPAHRGRGYGGAITARAVLDGAASGARWAWLQSSDDARRLYERLGFRAVETGSLWMTY